MSVLQADAEAKDFIGSRIITPDGEGVVTEADDRYVGVKLDNGALAQFGHRDVTLAPKAAKPAEPVAPPAPPVSPVAPVETPAPEAPAQ